MCSAILTKYRSLDQAFFLLLLMCFFISLSIALYSVEALADQEVSQAQQVNRQQAIPQQSNKPNESISTEQASKNLTDAAPENAPPLLLSEKEVSAKQDKESSLSDQEKIFAMVIELGKINLQLMQVDIDEKTVLILLDKKTELLAKLMLILRMTKIDSLPKFISNERLNFLDSRISINQERGNTVAVMRDQVQRQFYLTKQNIRNLLLALISASKNYQSPLEVENIAAHALTENKQRERAFELPKINGSSKIYQDLQENYTQLLLANTTYQDILNYVIDHPRKIASMHWFQYMTINSSIAFFNGLDFSKLFNRKLAVFKLDVGGILTSLIIYGLIYFSFPVLFRVSNWAVETYLLDDEYSSEEIFYEEMRRPVKLLLIFTGIDMATYALLYKTDFRPALENISFVIYVLIDICLVFKALDCFVLIKIQNITKTNKALRKELFNLGVQIGKGFVVLVALAVVLNHFGISIAAIMSTMGIGGLAFALAAKDTLSNLFGGMTVLLDNVFKMGDWVKIGDMEGTVADIGLRSTTIRTFDNALVTIPNAIISVSSVRNWNRRAIGRRIKMYVGVTYESNMDDIRNALDELRMMLMEHPEIANPKQKIDSTKRRFRFSSHEDTQGIKSTQLVFMDRYNEYSIDILVYCFSRTVNWAEWLQVKEDVLFKIAAILQKNNLEFAYPTQVTVLTGETLYMHDGVKDQDMS